MTGSAGWFTRLPGAALYLAPLTLGGVGLGLILSGQWGWGLAALGAALGSGLTTRRLAQALAKAEAGRRAWDEGLLHTQKLAALGELAAGIAHEINNPLAIIRQEAEWGSRLLAKAPPWPEAEELQDALQEIIRQVERSREITHNLLNLARKQEPILQETDLNRLLESMARLVEKETQPRGIELRRDYQEDLPVILSDPPLLRQVALNLLNNARQALDGPGFIILRTRRLGPGEVAWSVHDSGPGIPAEIQDKIFDPFFTTKPPGEGTGLGLALCYNIVHKLGGRIEVESRPGEGTTFTVRLPLKV
jgi:two-component system NtrC family sensor kinase